eukprot:SAG31_NODE_22094_length_534_cov_0.816092_1_plen_117_part_01
MLSLCASVAATVVETCFSFDSFVRACCRSRLGPFPSSSCCFRRLLLVGCPSAFESDLPTELGDFDGGTLHFDLLSAFSVSFDFCFRRTLLVLAIGFICEPSLVNTPGPFAVCIVVAS